MTTITELQVADYLRSHVDWNLFYSVVDTLGSTMNSQKDRFDKSDIFEMSLEEFSNSNVKYLNEDGVDHVLVNLLYSNEPTTQEMKFLGSVFYQEYSITRANKKRGIAAVKGVRPSNKDVTIKLVNSHGSNKHTTLPKSYAKFLLVVDNYSVHVIEVSKLIPKLDFEGDGISAKEVPYGWFTKVVGPTDITDRKALPEYNYKEEKLKFQRDFLSKFRS